MAENHWPNDPAGPPSVVDPAPPEHGRSTRFAAPQDLGPRGDREADLLRGPDDLLADFDRAVIVFNEFVHGYRRLLTWAGPSPCSGRPASGRSIVTTGWPARSAVVWLRPDSR